MVAAVHVIDRRQQMIAANSRCTHACKEGGAPTNVDSWETKQVHVFGREGKKKCPLTDSTNKTFWDPLTLPSTKWAKLLSADVLFKYLSN